MPYIGGKIYKGNADLYRAAPGTSNDCGNDTLLYLYGAWKGSEKKHCDNGFIRRQVGQSANNGDSFTVYFNEAFLSYLPELGFQSELFVIFRFNEIYSGKNSNDNKETIKILGPLRVTGGSEGTFLHDFNRVTYGPVRISADALSVTIQIIEFDGGLIPGQRAVFRYFSNAHPFLNMLNPTNPEEKHVVKDIARYLESHDKNDSILNVGFDLLPYDENVASKWDEANKDVFPVPLKTGNYVVIQEEICNFATCYFGLSRRYSSLGADNLKEAPTYLLSGSLDVLAVPFVMLNRVLRHSPDAKSLSPIRLNGNGGKAKTTKNESIVLDTNTKRLYLRKNSKRMELYKDKSWITFSIEKGRHTPRIKRQPTHEELKQLLIQSLNNQVPDKKLGLLDNASLSVNPKETRQSTELCFSKPKDSMVEFSYFTGNGKSNIVEEKIVDFVCDKQTPLSDCCTLTINKPDEVGEGKYEIWFQVKETSSVHYSSHKLDYDFKIMPVQKSNGAD